MTIAAEIHDKLVEGLSPVALEVINESHMHRTKEGAETHFKVVVVSASFEGKALLARHRLVNALLQAELEGPVHALAIHAYTPAQWTERGGEIPASPPCRGRGKKPA